MPEKRFRIIAGPNGSGKSSIVRHLKEYFSDQHYFNADVIKDALEKAGAYKIPFSGLTIEELIAHVEAYIDDVEKCEESVKQFKRKEIIIQKNQFICEKKKISSYSSAIIASFLVDAAFKRRVGCTFETVFSHPSKIEMMKKAKELGYKVYLYFISTESVEINIGRVKDRVAGGGHDVDTEKIRTRYPAAMSNILPALEHVYRAYFFDNTVGPMLHAEYTPEQELILIGMQPQSSMAESVSIQLKNVLWRQYPPKKSVKEKDPDVFLSKEQKERFAQQGRDPILLPTPGWIKSHLVDRLNTENIFFNLHPVSIETDETKKK